MWRGLRPCWIGVFTWLPWKKKEARLTIMASNKIFLILLVGDYGLTTTPSMHSNTVDIPIAWWKVIKKIKLTRISHLAQFVHSKTYTVPKHSNLQIIDSYSFYLCYFGSSNRVSKIRCQTSEWNRKSKTKQIILLTGRENFSFTTSKLPDLSAVTKMLMSAPSKWFTLQEYHSWSNPNNKSSTV